MELIRDFKMIGKNDVALAGGKGASLGEMTKAGISVPEGFVILSNAFEKFLEETDLNVEIDAILDSINHKEMHTVENASEKIQSLILWAGMPKDISVEIQKFFRNLNSKYVAVRSSATAEDSANATWAGQLESYLNTTEKDLMENVMKCWASLFTPRAIFYRFEKDFHKQKISVAVVVQKMVDSEKSGIAFSVHPVTQDRNQLIIEAGLGLGEAIVSGQITPDSYVVEKQPRRIIDKNVQTKKSVLLNTEILKLSGLILKIESHLGFPCDVEWAFEKGKFYIVQSRPITALDSKIIGLPQKLFEKFLTRDAPLIAIEHWWYRGCTEAFPAFFGFSFPRIIIVKTNNVFTSYWDTTLLDNYIQAFRDWLKNNPDRLELIHNRLIEGLELFRKVRKLDTHSSLQEFTEALRATVHHFLQGLPAVDAVHVLPGLYDRLKVAEKSSFDKSQISKLISWREKAGNFFFNEGIDTFYFLLEQIGEKKNWPIDLLKYSTYRELTDALSDTFPLPLNELTKRRDSKFAYIDGEIIFEPEIEIALRQIGYALHQEDISHVNEIKGTPAMRGKARGVCRIIFDRDHLDDFGEGEILVAPMTSPWYIPAIKLAAAVVTDEGGITCHAAIITRELQKPCVVGTKIATQVLKNGDLVEVDANEGVVKILK